MQKIVKLICEKKTATELQQVSRPLEKKWSGIPYATKEEASQQTNRLIRLIRLNRLNRLNRLKQIKQIKTA